MKFVSTVAVLLGSAMTVAAQTPSGWKTIKDEKGFANSGYPPTGRSTRLFRAWQQHLTSPIAW